MSASPWMPWRSVWVPRVLTAVALVVGLPLFLRTPPWCDITLYQLAARNILHGGVHYRDLFDTNLPGFVWAMTALYSVFGSSAVAVRAVDLGIVFGVVLLLDRLAKWAGATPATRWWALAGAALFYPFTVEMAHAQRDTWMVLPGLAAVALRLRRGIGAEPTPPTPLPEGKGEKELSELSIDRSDQGSVARVHPPSLQGGGAGGGRSGERGGSSPFRRSIYEGLLWGAGVWMKPHLALMAGVVWLLTVRRLAGEHPRPWRAAAADLLGNLIGGLVVAVPGVVWMFASGAWAPFLDVFTNWNPWYVKLAQVEFEDRATLELFWFAPWSLGLVLTVPLAVVSVLDAAFWSSRRSATTPARPGPVGYWLPWLLWDKSAGADARFVRGALGGLYLAWAAQAFFLQRGFQYAHVPETFLMLALWAAHRWAWVPLALVWLVVTSGIWVVADHNADAKAWIDELPQKTQERYLPRHPLSNFDRLRLWPTCFRPDLTDAERFALWDRLKLHPLHEASIGWEELAEVAAFLRAKGVGDGDVIAWFDSPHAVYLLLDVKPGFRYMHVFTVISISVAADGTGKIGRQIALDAAKEAWTARPPGRVMYVVSDVEWTTLGVYDPTRLTALRGPAADPPRNLLPAATPYPDEFPFNQPALFRTRNNTGRYVVHRIDCVCDNPK